MNHSPQFPAVIWSTPVPPAPVYAGGSPAALIPAALLSAGLVFGAASVATAAKSPKLPKSGVETPPAATLSETGSTLMYPLFNVWVPAYTQLFPEVSIQTAGTGSGTGIADATDGTADIGASDAYLSPSDVTASPSLKNIPLAISAQLIAYNVPGVSAHLKLSGKVLSAIYQGKVTTWNNKAITSLNPGVTLPSLAIVTLHRADSSGDTFLFTQFLSKTDPSGWGDTLAYNTTIVWPNVPGALGETGNSGMVAGCKATPGCVAYIGISYETQVLQSGLGYAELQNGKGHFELPTAQTIGAEAAAFVSKTPANGTISLIDGPAAGGYPVVNYEYAIVNAKQPSASTAKAIRSVLEWAVNAKGGNASTYLAQVNFQPLPTAIATKSLKQILEIK